jgi:hypothetical protein
VRREAEDKFHGRVLELIENRAQTAVPGNASSQQTAGAPVVDVMNALHCAKAGNNDWELAD